MGVRAKAIEGARRSVNPNLGTRDVRRASRNRILGDREIPCYNLAVMGRRLSVWGAGFAASALLAVPAGAGSVEERASRAGAVIVGECEVEESHWEGGAIWTHAEIRIRDQVRGESLPDVVTVRQRGGVVGRVGQRVTHEIPIQGGREYLLLLGRDGEGRWQPLAQGVEPIEVDEDGTRRIRDEALAAMLSRLREPR